VGVLDSRITGPSIRACSIPQVPTSNNTPWESARPRAQPIKPCSLSARGRAVSGAGPLIGGPSSSSGEDVVWGDLDTPACRPAPGHLRSPALTVMQRCGERRRAGDLTAAPGGRWWSAQAARMVQQMATGCGLDRDMSYALCPDGQTRLEVFGPATPGRWPPRWGAPVGTGCRSIRRCHPVRFRRIEEYPAVEFAPSAPARWPGRRPAPDRDRGEVDPQALRDWIGGNDEIAVVTRTARRSGQHLGTPPTIAV